LALSFAVGLGTASSARTVASPSLGMKLDRYLRSMLAAREFQGAVLLARNGRVVFSHGYGFANRARRQANTPHTRFRLVMATELFNQIATLQLRDRGRLKLANSVCRFVRACPSSWRGITIEALLAHRSGLADVHPLARRRPPLTISAAVTWLEHRQVRSVSRDESPAATIVLASVIEAASGEPWLQYLHRHIFDPAQMMSTGMGVAAAQPGQAVGYLLPNERAGHDVSFTEPDPSQGLWSTVLDIYRLDRALYAGTILRHSSVNELFPPNQHVVSGYHAWDIGDGFYTLIGRHTPDHLLVVLLANGRKLKYRFYEIENYLAAAAAGGSRPAGPATGPADLAYVSSSGILMVAAADGTHPRALTKVYAGMVSFPTWAPDGKQIAFTRYHGAQADIYVIRVNGMGERKLTSGSSPAWSPDGRTIAYIDASKQLALLDPISGRSRRFPGLPVAGSGGLSWSPDGRSILLLGNFYGGERDRNATRNHLEVVPRRGGRPRIISRKAGFYLTSATAWSPDATSITYSYRTRLGASISSAAAFLAAPDGSSAHPIGTNAYLPPRFSANGQTVVFNLGLGCSVRVAATDGSASHDLSFAACQAAWRRGAAPP
jgi:CubicO group peptidase (beta-lactamase class C family)